MDAGFLERLLGGSRAWAGPCVVIIDSASNIDVPGPDSIVTGGQKSYAPRVSTGRLVGDALLLLKEEGVLLVVEQHRHKDGTGQSHVKQKLSVLDVKHVVGLEFKDTTVLKALAVGPPPAVRDTEYRPGMLVG